MGYEGPPFGVVIPAGYTFDNMGTCGACRAAIAWCLTKKGNRAPMNPDGTSHFATCPNAADFRKPKPGPEPDERDAIEQQRAATLAVMSDGWWRTPDAIVAAVNALTGKQSNWAAVGARVRDLRKPRYGGHTVARRYVTGGVHEYRLVPEEGTR